MTVIVADEPSLIGPLFATVEIVGGRLLTVSENVVDVEVVPSFAVIVTVWVSVGPSVGPKDQLQAADTKQTGTQNQLDEVTKEKQVIGNCLTLLSEAIVAANSGDAATAKSKADAAQAPCDEAQKYLN